MSKKYNRKPQRGERMELDLDTEVKVVLLFSGIGILLGAINGAVRPDSILALIIAIIGFYLSYRIVPYVIDVEDSSFEYTAANTLKKGVLPYWFLWLVAWTLVYTYLWAPM